MRVISGEFRGRPLKAPKGQGTRPTTDRVKESLMSSLTSILGGFDGLFVLDAFAGSGGLGIETLSRGAAFALFCDSDRSAIAAVQENLNLLQLPRTRAMAKQGNVLASAPTAAKPFDLVFLDPPYALPAEDVFAFIRSLRTSERLSQDGVIVYEHDSKDSVDHLLVEGDVPRYEIIKSKKHGTTTIDIIGLLS